MIKKGIARGREAATAHTTGAKYKSTYTWRGGGGGRIGNQCARASFRVVVHPVALLLLLPCTLPIGQLPESLRAEDRPRLPRRNRPRLLFPFHQCFMTIFQMCRAARVRISLLSPSVCVCARPRHTSSVRGKRCTDGQLRGTDFQPIFHAWPRPSYGR